MRFFWAITLPCLLWCNTSIALSYSFDDLNRYSKNNPIQAPSDPGNFKPKNSIYHVTADDPTIVVELPFQGGTGYMWFLEKIPASVIVEKQFVQFSGDLPGGPGTSIWQIRVKPGAFKAPQKIVLEFTYQRIWEANSARKEVVTIFTE